jgi:uncharacterized protein involved in outer membrane biogenesis
MRLKALFFRFALGVSAFLLPIMVFAALVPSLINAEPVKKRFLQELRSSTGGEVELAGPVSIESFFSLSINAENVRFKGMKGIASFQDLSAAQIVARISWIDLLAGKLEFDKIKIQGAALAVNKMDRGQIGEALATALGAPARLAFTDLVVSDCRVTIYDAGQVAEAFDIQTVSVDLRRSAREIRAKGQLSLDGDELSAKVTVRTLRAKDRKLSAEGKFQFAAKNSGSLSGLLGLPPHNILAGPASWSGAFEFSGDRLSLRDMTLASGLADASGDLTVLTTPGGQRVEGSLAMSELDLSRIWSASTGERHDAALTETLLTRIFDAETLDLRLSADRVRLKGLTTGAAAFTLTGDRGRLSSEIAHLDLLGGSMLGQADAEFRSGRLRAKARLTSENIGAAQLIALGFAEEWVTGELEADLEAETQGVNFDELRTAMRANLRVSFPEGGRMRLDPAQLARLAASETVEGWDRADLTWRSFSDLRFTVSLGDQRLRCSDLMLTSEAGTVKGAGEIDLAQGGLNWRLDISPAESAGIGQDGGKNNTDTGLSITGSWSRPAFRTDLQSNRAGSWDNKVLPHSVSIGRRL